MPSILTQSGQNQGWQQDRTRHCGLSSGWRLRARGPVFVSPASLLKARPCSWRRRGKSDSTRKTLYWSGSVRAPQESGPGFAWPGWFDSPLAVLRDSPRTPLRGEGAHPRSKAGAGFILHEETKCAGGTSWPLLECVNAHRFAVVSGVTNGCPPGLVRVPCSQSPAASGARSWRSGPARGPAPWPCPHP